MPVKSKTLRALPYPYGKNTEDAERKPHLSKSKILQRKRLLTKSYKMASISPISVFHNRRL
jgi:hypothetical protein